VSVKPAYDQQGLMRRYDIVSTVCDYMLQLGWEPYQNDHEDANGQFEVRARAMPLICPLPLHTSAP
jgi:glutamine synthetase